MTSNAEKLLQKALRDQQKRIKPGECDKYVRLVLDFRAVTSPFGQELLLGLSNSQLKYDVRDLPQKDCIIWERNVGQRLLIADDPEKLANVLTDEWQQENQVVRLVHAQEFEKAIRTSALSSIVESLQSAFPSKYHTLIALNKKKKNSNASAIATAIIELQILHKVGVHQLQPSVKELLQLLRHFTKSIAEAPYKQQKSETLGSFKKYLANDKKQCVRVVGTNGFGRLWQQHLNRLPLVTLEVAETIIAKYSCPKKLLDEFQSNPNVAINQIAELKISRGGPAPLQTDRRIGNVLSTKLYTLYNARDPNALL